MKKSRKTALAALLFSAAMNMNGCVYGPPPESEAISSEKSSSPTVVTEEENVTDETSNTDEKVKEKEI